MATTVDTLLVRIDADLKGVNSKLKQFDKTVQNTANKSDRNFNKIASVAKGVFAAAIVMQAARAGLALIKFTSGVEEMQAKSSVVFGEFVGQVRSDLEEFGNSVGRSTHELEGMASSIQDTFVPMGFARGDAADLSVQLTKLAVDVASFNNASDTATMEAFQSALVGNHETVRRFGIVITEATLQQELYRMGIDKTSKNATNAEKVQARLNLIMAGTSDAHGDAARTSDSFANQSKALTASLEELTVNVLTPMLPALAGLVGGLVDATNAMNGFLDAVGVIDLDPLATKSENLAKKQKELAEAQEDLSYWTKIANDEFAQGNALLNFLQRGAGDTLIENKIEGATEKIAQLRLESLAAHAELMKLTGADQATQGRPRAKKPEAAVAEAVPKEILDAIEAQKFANQQLKDEVNGVSSAQLKANEVMKDFKTVGKEQKDELLLLIQQEEIHEAALNAQTEATKKLKEAEDRRLESISKGKDTFDQLMEDNAILLAQIDGQTEAQIKQLEAAFELGNLEGGQSERILKQIAENEALNQTLIKKKEHAATASTFMEGLKTEEEELVSIQEALNAAFENGDLSLDKFTVAQDALKVKLVEIKPEFKRLKDAAEQAATGIADSLADAFVNGKLSMEGLGDMFKNIIKQMIADAIKAQIIKMLMGSIFAGFGGGSVNMGNTTLSHAGGGSISRYGRAGGGMAMPTLVGERGPELFVPHTAGVIRNNHDTKNMMGGGSPTVVNQNINIDAGVSQTVRAEVMSMIPMIKSETINAMIDGKRRGNSVSKAFA